MPRRICRDIKYEEVYQKLCEGDEAVFNQLKDVFLIAACIGFKFEQRKPLSKKGKDFPWSVFNGDTDESIINAIALIETNEFSVVIDQQGEEIEDRVTIIEEYANAGIEYLINEVIEKPGSPTENLLAFINLQFTNEDNEQYTLDNFVI